MTKELFGTDGIRGIPGTYPLDDATLYGVARALGKYLLEIEPQAARPDRHGYARIGASHRGAACRRACR